MRPGRALPPRSNCPGIPSRRSGAMPNSAAKLFNSAVDEIAGSVEDQIRKLLNERPGVTVQGVTPLATGHDN